MGWFSKDPIIDNGRAADKQAAAGKDFWKCGVAEGSLKPSHRNNSWCGRCGAQLANDPVGDINYLRIQWDREHAERMKAIRDIGSCGDLRQQRDDLLAACKAMKTLLGEAIGGKWCAPIIEQAEDAIARAEGEKG